MSCSFKKTFAPGGIDSTDMVDRKKITYPTIRIEILDSAASILTLVAMDRDQLLIFNATEHLILSR